MVAQEEAISTPKNSSRRSMMSLSTVKSRSNGAGESNTQTSSSPLGKLFSRRPFSVIDRSTAVQGEAIEDLANGVTKLEHAFNQLNTQTVGKLSEEIKELHVRFRFI